MKEQLKFVSIKSGGVCVAAVSTLSTGICEKDKWCVDI